MLIGIISAFGASLSWTYACSIWRMQTTIYKPININFLKNIIAFIIFSPTILLFNYSTEYKYFFILILSGIVGIGLGDTFYLKSLKMIGTRKTLSIEALSPLIAAFTGGFFINESLSIKSWIGIIVISTSLILIIRKKTVLLDKESKLIHSKISFGKFLYAFLSIICAVFAALLSRLVLVESDLMPIQTTEIRLLGAIFFLFPINNFKLHNLLEDSTKKEKGRFIISVIMGTNIGIFLQQTVFQNLPLGIGWTLLSTSPVFSLFFAKKEEGILTKSTIALTLFLFTGISLILL
mgnify:CR=1 FL=1|tara:strand:+ start:413 stop:1291 length:879 start_codon:yes stop_codon:yes gene_type:complete